MGSGESGGNVATNRLITTMALGEPRKVQNEVVAPGTPTPERIDGDRRLAEAIIGKDRKAAAEFVTRYSDPLYGYVASRLTPRTDLVDDLVQDVFVAALEGLDRYASQSSLQAWLMGIARHKVEDYYRARLRQLDSLTEAEEDLADDTSAPLQLDRRLDRRRLQRKTLVVLRQLPEQHSVVLLWRYWERRSAREMASQTGKTEKAIERLLARARARFKKLWEAE